MFIMVTLPEDCDATVLLRQALNRRVAFVPGQDFHVGDKGKNTLRLNFTNVRPGLIEEGIHRLRNALESLGGEGSSELVNRAFCFG